MSRTEKEEKQDKRGLVPEQQEQSKTRYLFQGLL
jgi:hypothetical protein